MEKLVFFDLETTGLDLVKDDVIQIAAVAVTYYPFKEKMERASFDFEELDRFEVKIAPTPQGLENLWEGSNYSPEVWAAEQVPAGLAWRRFFAFLRRHSTVERTSKGKGTIYRVAQLAGHNVDKFDKQLVWREGRHHDLYVPASGNCWDTVQLAITARVLGFPEVVELPDLRLGTLAAAAGYPLGDDAHEALADVRATVAVARWLVLLHKKWMWAV